MIRSDAPVAAVRARAFTVPTGKPEADGTFAWEVTTLVAVQAEAGGMTGLGYTCADASNVSLTRRRLCTAAISSADVGTIARPPQ